MTHHLSQDLTARVQDEQARLLSVSSGSAETDQVVAAWCALVSDVILHLEAEYATGTGISRRPFRDWIDAWSDLYVSAEELEEVKPLVEQAPLDL